MKIRMLILALALLAAPACAQEDLDAPPNFIVAKVNDDFITMYEVWERIESVVTAIRQQPDDLLSPEEKRRQQRIEERRALREIMEEKLILQAAKKVGIQVSDETVESKIEEEAKEVGGMENLLKIIGDQGIKITEFQESFKKRLTTQELLLHKFGLSEGEKAGRAQIDMFISPREIVEFYEENKDTQFVEPPRAKIRQIIVYTNRERTVQSAMELAQSIVLQLRQGADFVELASEYSEGPNKKNGGAWPTQVIDGKETWVYITPGTGMPEVEKAAFGLPAGSVSDPIAVTLQDRRGGERHAIFIVQVVDSQPPRSLPLREVQESIRDSLYDKKLYGNVERIKRELMKDAYIEVFEKGSDEQEIFFPDRRTDEEPPRSSPRRVEPNVREGK